MITEFKSDLKRYPDNDLIDEIVGMANTKGGNLYLGVEDDGQITGVNKIHKDAIGVTALVANNTVPSVSVRAEIITEEEKDILKIEIPISRTVVSTRSGKMLKRRLKADGTPEVIPMFSYEIVTRLSELALLDFSAGPLAGASINDFDPNQRIRLRNIIQTRPGGEKNLLALKRIGLAEKTGRGIDRIYEGSIIYGRPWPDYSETTSTNVRLFIQRAKADDTFTKFIADEQNRLGKPLSIYALMILSLLKNEKRLTIERIAKMTHLAEGKLRGAIENLIEDGLVEGVGSGKSRSYILSVKVYKENNRSIQYVRQTGIDRVSYPEMIIKLAGAQDGFITKQDVAELLKITPDQAYSEIKKLVSKGKIYKYCGGKYTKYKLR